jgi:hypothetical protein
MLIEIHDRDLGSLFGKGNCGRAPYPAVASSDERYLATQLATPLMFRVVRLRARPHFIFPARLSRLRLLWLPFFLCGHGI